MSQSWENSVTDRWSHRAFQQGQDSNNKNFFDIAMVPLSGFLWATNSSDHRRALTADLLHVMQLPNTLGHEAMRPNGLEGFQCT